MKKTRVIGMFLFLVITYSLVSVFKSYAVADMIGKKAPEINVVSWLNTEPLKLNDLKGKIIVLEFWATWCPPCRASIPHLIELYNEYKDKNVVFISITDEPKNKIQSFVEENKMEYPIGAGGDTSRKYEIEGIPHAFIINKKGVIVWEGHPMQGLDKVIKKEAGKK